MRLEKVRNKDLKLILDKCDIEYLSSAKKESLVKLVSKEIKKENKSITKKDLQNLLDLIDVEYKKSDSKSVLSKLLLTKEKKKDTQKKVVEKKEIKKVAKKTKPKKTTSKKEVPKKTTTKKEVQKKTSSKKETPKKTTAKKVTKKDEVIQKRAKASKQKKVLNSDQLVEEVKLEMQQKNFQKMKIKELKEFANDNNIPYVENVNKKGLLHEIERFMSRQEKEITKKQNIATDLRGMNPVVKAENGLDTQTLKVIEKVVNSAIEIARNEKNTIDDITIDKNLHNYLGEKYDLVAFARVENKLLEKNIIINYTHEELKEKISQIQATDEGISEEEINHSIETLLRGVKGSHNTDEVKNFLSSINDYPLLPKEKEIQIGEILKRINGKKENGEILNQWEVEEYEQARELLALSNKRLVVSVAKKYINRGMDLIDLVMEGMMGLEKAILKYDYQTGFKFSTYATWWIRQGITRAIADKSKVIRVPVHMVETINKVTKVQRELFQKLGTEPTIEQIAKEIKPKMSKEEVEYVFNISRDPISLEMPIGDDNSTLESFIEDDKHLTQEEESVQSELRNKLLAMIQELPEVEEEVILYRYGLYDLDTKQHEESRKFFIGLHKKLKEKKIDVLQLDELISESELVNSNQKEKYIKRIHSNIEKNEDDIEGKSKYEECLNIVEKYTDSKEKNEKDKVEKSNNMMMLMHDSNIKYLETIIEQIEERINNLTEIDELTNGIVKPLTLEEVGTLKKVTRERIRQIETKAKRKLKAFSEKYNLGLFTHD